jgi:hypothetical protein
LKTSECLKEIAVFNPEFGRNNGNEFGRNLVLSYLRNILLFSAMNECSRQ